MGKNTDRIRERVSKAAATELGRIGGDLLKGYLPVLGEAAGTEFVPRGTAADNLVWEQGICTRVAERIRATRLTEETRK